MKALILVAVAFALVCLSLGSAAAGAGGAPRAPAAVIGADQREHVEDTTLYPYSAIAMLKISSQVGEHQCTGTFIGEDVLITAAHCLWDSDFGYVDDVLVLPGKDGIGPFSSSVHAAYEPFGREYASGFMVPQEYIDQNGSNSVWDFGLVAMADADLGSTVGWLRLGNLQTSTLERPDLQPAIIGYPFDLGDGEEMWRGTKPALLSVDDFILNYDIDTAGGESGSAIISLNRSEWFGLYVVGIHTTGMPDYNFGSRIDDKLLDAILGICADLGCTIDYFTEPFLQGVLWADADCDGEMTTRDNQAILRIVLTQPALSQTDPCTPIGGPVAVDGFGDQDWGDADCDGGLSSRDSQSVLRKVLLQSPLSQTPPCPGVGDEVTLGGLRVMGWG